MSKLDRIDPDQDEPDFLITHIHRSYFLISDRTHFATGSFDRSCITITDSIERPNGVVTAVLLSCRPGMGLPLNIRVSPIVIKYEVWAKDGRKLPTIEKVIDLTNPISFK
jgi:hypothetical protein